MPKPTQLVTIELPRPLWRQVKALLRIRRPRPSPVSWLSDAVHRRILEPLVKGGKQQ